MNTLAIGYCDSGATNVPAFGLMRIRPKRSHCDQTMPIQTTKSDRESASQGYIVHAYFGACSVLDAEPDGPVVVLGADSGDPFEPPELLAPELPPELTVPDVLIADPFSLVVELLVGPVEPPPCA